MLALAEPSCPASGKMCQLVGVCCAGTLRLPSDGFEMGGRKKKRKVFLPGFMGFCVPGCMGFWVWEGLCHWGPGGLSCLIGGLELWLG